MTSITAHRLLGLASLGLLAAAPALAQEPGFYYGGIGVGQSRTDTDPYGLTSGLLPGVGAASAVTDEKDTAYKLFGGHQLNRHFALELGYFNLGRNGFGATTAPAGSLSGQTRVQGINLDLVGTLPLTDRFSMLGRVGGQYAWSRSRFAGTGAAAGVPGSSSRRDGGYKVGLGVQYELNPSMWLRGEVERYRIKDAVGHRSNVDMVSVSLVFPFGRAAERPRPMAAAYVPPAPVAAPPPEPVAVVAEPVALPPPAPVPQRISLSADAVFGSSQSALRPQGRADLDRFSQQLQGARYDTISVEGHTDRMGSAPYNQRLSEQRASVVKDYLVVQGRIDPARISASGKGEGSPVTAAADCADRLPRTRLIECLQPDRRVEIEVQGTR